MNNLKFEVLHAMSDTEWKTKKEMFEHIDYSRILKEYKKDSLFIKSMKNDGTIVTAKCGGVHYWAITHRGISILNEELNKCL